MDIQSLFNLNGRVAVVTGGSRGIGKMIVEGYLKAGAARVYISARKVGQIEETVAEFGSQVIGLPCRPLTAAFRLPNKSRRVRKKSTFSSTTQALLGVPISVSFPKLVGTGSWT